MNAFPQMLRIFQPTQNKLSYRDVVTLLTPQFAVEGSNERIQQKNVYHIFMKYLREAGGKILFNIILIFFSMIRIM